MRLNLSILTLMGLAACDAEPIRPGLDGGPPGPLDTAVPIHVTTTSPLGTQIGSEGLWGCPIEMVEILDGTEEITSLDGSSETRTAALVGDWPLQISVAETDTTTLGTLTITDVAEYHWLTVADQPGCVDHLAAHVEAVLTPSGTVGDLLHGFVAIRPDASRLFVAVDGDLAGLQTAWGAPSFDSDTQQFRVQGSVDPTVLEGSVSFVDCLEIGCATTDALGTLTSIR